MRNQISKLIRKITEPPRSDRWRTVRKYHLIKEGWCRSCGGIKDLEVHHVNPFHIDPDKELDDSNLITLCETIGTHCHLKVGHLGNWKKFNPDVRAQAIAPIPNVAKV